MAKPRFDTNKITELALAWQVAPIKKKAVAALMKEAQPFLDYSVYNFLKTYRGSLDREDAFQEAALGMLIALTRWDQAKGELFTSYASWWIDAQLHSLNKCGPVLGPKQSSTFKKYGPSKIIYMDSLTFPDELIGADTNTPLTLLLAKERKDIPANWMKHLSRVERKVINAILDGAESYQAIADSMGFSKQNAHGVYLKALAKIKKAAQVVV